MEETVFGGEKKVQRVLGGGFITLVTLGFKLLQAVIPTGEVETVQVLRAECTLVVTYTLFTTMQLPA